jgi:peptidoglycan hydrolase-like protein with peptidoglycan-binding domain
MNNLSIIKAPWLRRSFLVSALFIASLQLVSAEENPVVEVQRTLKLKHFYYGEVDGNFDCATQGALRRFQFRNGLPGTGAMDPETLQALSVRPASSPASPKAIAANIPARPESERAPGPAIEKDEISAGIKAAPVADPRRVTSAELVRKEQLTVPHAAYSEQFPSWSAQRRGIIENGVEIRRAIPVTPETSNSRQFIPRAIPVSQADSIGGAGFSEGVTVAAHFTGQDGHVYTYYRKIKAAAPDASRSPASPDSPYGIGGMASSPPDISVWDGTRGGNIAHR